MSSIWKTIARGFGYLLFFLAALVFFVYVTFPMEQVRGYVEYQAQKRLKMDVRIGELALKGLGGVELWDVVVVLPEKAKELSSAEAAEAAAAGRPGGPATEAPPGRLPTRFETPPTRFETPPTRFETPPTRFEAPPDGDLPTRGATEPATRGAAPPKLPATRGTAAARPPAATKGAAPVVDDGADAAGDKKKGKKSKGLVVKIDHVDITVKLIDVLFGKNPDVRIDADLLGGSISNAHVSRDGKKIHVEAKEISGLDVSATPLLGYFLPFDIRGKLSGSVDFTWGGTLWDSRGTIELALAQSAIREPELKSKAYGDFKLTDVKTGSLAIKVAVGKKKDIPMLRAVPGPKDATVIHLEKVESSGEDAELITEERSVFVLRKGKPFGDASMSMEIAFALADGFFDREVVRSGEKEKPNKFLKYLFEHDAKWKKAEKNGFYGLRCSGIVKRPDCSPVRPSMRVGFAKTRAEGGDADPKGTPDKEKGGDQQKRPDQPSAQGDKGGTREPGVRPTIGTVQDLPRERPAQPEATADGPPPKVPRIRTPATGVDPKVRIEQLKREREERLREMRAARGLPPDPVIEEPLPEDDLLPLDDELLPLDDELLPEEGGLDELPLDEAPVDLPDEDPNFDPER